MEFIAKEISKEEEEYIYSLNLRYPYGNENPLYFRQHSIIVKDEKMENIFFSVWYWPESDSTVYYLIHKGIKISFEVDCIGYMKFSIRKINIPEELWKEREELTEVIIKMLIQYIKYLNRFRDIEPQINIEHMIIRCTDINV